MMRDEYARRELYMRLYASLARHENFYPAQFCAGIEPLLDQGHVVAIEGGYRLTAVGIVAWKSMNPHGIVKPIPTKPQPKPAKEEPMTPVQIKLLRLLSDGETHAISHRKNQALNTLCDTGLVERVGSADWRITETGRTKLAELEQPKQRRQRKGQRVIPPPSKSQSIVPVARDTSLMQLEVLFK